MPIRRRFGQNFLTDPHALRKIVEALALSGEETVLEIGPGRGALTDLLAGRCRRLVAVEIDRDLVAMLRARYADRPQVTIVEGDILAQDPAALAGGPYVLAGNVPYYITTPIIFHALRPPMPRRAVFLVQREVAERLQAGPGSRTYGALTVNVALVARVEIVGTVGAGAFFPRPQVDSAIVRLTPHGDADENTGDLTALRGFVTALFGQRRRQLVRAVRTVAALDASAAADVVAAAGLQGDARPESLDPAAFQRLHGALMTRRA